MRPHCMCESSLCDHDFACTREPHPRLFMKYVGGTCPDCADAMIESGGAAYIFLRCEDCDDVLIVYTDADIRCSGCASNYHEHLAQMAGRPWDGLSE